MIRVETVVLPAFLASALINGDTSGLEESELKWVEAACEYVKPGRIVSYDGEPYFASWCELPGYRLADDMLEYTVLYSDERLDDTDVE